MKPLWKPLWKMLRNPSEGTECAEKGKQKVLGGILYQKERKKAR